MKELSLHILDIVQNSVKAGAEQIEITIEESRKKNRMAIEIIDNGCGMSPEFLKRVTDPFTTTRTTRKVGLGIPLFQLAAQQAGGDFAIWSEPGTGTKVTAVFQKDHIDRAPMGDIAGTMVNLIQTSPQIRFLYHHRTDCGAFDFDTREAAEILEDVPLNDYSVLSWLNGYLSEGIREIGGELYGPAEI